MAIAGSRRFLNDGDYAAYLDLMAQRCGEEGVEIWGYCLMPNHVHLIAVPKTKDGLRWVLWGSWPTRRLERNGSDR